MKSNELRLRNYVIHPRNNEIRPIEGVLGARVYFDLDRDFVNIEDVKPIPLTPEILERLGFSDKEYKDGYIGIDVCNTDFPLTIPTTEEKSYIFKFIVGGVPLVKIIEHVHELQNLFFALTDEELIFKQ